MAVYAVQSQMGLLYICKEIQKPAACVLVMRVLLVSVFLMGDMLKGLTTSPAKHAKQTGSRSLSFFLRHKHFHGQTY